MLCFVLQNMPTHVNEVDQSGPVFYSCSSNFPNMGSESYNIVLSNFVLHWVADKGEAFRSLKPEGKIVLTYCDRMPSGFDRVYRELNPENLERIENMHKFEARPVIEEMCTAAGFNILKSYDVKMRDFVFEDGDSLRSYFWATTHGVFDPQLVTEDKVHGKLLCSIFKRES